MPYQAIDLEAARKYFDENPEQIQHSEAEQILACLLYRHRTALPDLPIKSVESSETQENLCDALDKVNSTLEETNKNLEAIIGFMLNNRTI